MALLPQSRTPLVGSPPLQPPHPAPPLSRIAGPWWGQPRASSSSLIRWRRTGQSSAPARASRPMRTVWGLCGGAGACGRCFRGRRTSLCRKRAQSRSRRRGTNRRRRASRCVPWGAWALVRVSRRCSCARWSHRASRTLTAPRVDTHRPLQCSVTLSITLGVRAATDIASSKSIADGLRTHGSLPDTFLRTRGQLPGSSAANSPMRKSHAPATSGLQGAVSVGQESVGEWGASPRRRGVIGVVVSLWESWSEGAGCCLALEARE